MTTKQGQIKKIKLIATNPPLVYFQLGEEHCLIARHVLNFFSEAKPGMKAIIWGHVNARGQFIVRGYRLFGKTQLMVDFELSPYPSRNGGSH